MPPYLEHLILFFLGLACGFIGTHAGGTALISIPIMTVMGIPIQSAVANSRISALLGGIGGIGEFHRRGKIDYPLALPACIFTVCGAFAGATFFLRLSPEHVQLAVSVLLLVLAPFTLIFRKRPPATPRAISPRRRIFGYLLLALVAAVGSFAGAQALLATYVYLFVFHKTMSESVGTRKISSLAATIVNAGLYGFAGIIEWGLAFALASGSLIGAHYSARYGLDKGDKWISALFTTMVVLLSLKMLYSFL